MFLGLDYEQVYTDLSAELSLPLPPSCRCEKLSVYVKQSVNSEAARTLGKWGNGPAYDALARYRYDRLRTTLPADRALLCLLVLAIRRGECGARDDRRLTDLFLKIDTIHRWRNTPRHRQSTVNQDGMTRCLQASTTAMKKLGGSQFLWSNVFALKIEEDEACSEGP